MIMPLASLSVGSRMSYRYVLYSYASVIAEVPECSAGKLSTQVGDYAVRNPEMMYDLIEELYSLL